MLELIKGMVDTIKNDLELEKSRRAQSEEQLLLLLEDLPSLALLFEQLALPVKVFELLTFEVLMP